MKENYSNRNLTCHTQCVSPLHNIQILYWPLLLCQPPSLCHLHTLTSVILRYFIILVLYSLTSLSTLSQSAPSLPTYSHTFFSIHCPDYYWNIKIGCVKHSYIVETFWKLETSLNLNYNYNYIHSLLLKGFLMFYTINWNSTETSTWTSTWNMVNASKKHLILSWHQCDLLLCFPVLFHLPSFCLLSLLRYLCRVLVNTGFWVTPESSSIAKQPHGICAKNSS